MAALKRDQYTNEAHPQEEIKLAEVIDIFQREKEKESENEKEVKRTKDGKIKRTPNNTKYNRDNVYPFKEEDIPKMVNYFREKIKNSADANKEFLNRRNLAIFIMGINIGLRGSDLLALRWNDVFNANWEFLEGKKITPKKTKKYNKKVLLKYNNSFKRAILDYKNHCKIDDMNDYIFVSNKGVVLEPDSFGDIIKKAAKDVGITYNVRMHSLRKTFARIRYDHASDKSDILIKLMKIFRHAAPSITLDYIGVTENELSDLYNSVNSGYQDDCEDDMNEID